jgi:hypothetical protein
MSAPFQFEDKQIERTNGRTANGVDVCLAVFLQLAALLLEAKHRQLIQVSSMYQEHNLEDARLILALFLRKLAIHGSLDLPCLLHQLRVGP